MITIAIICLIATIIYASIEVPRLLRSIKNTKEEIKKLKTKI